jgi:hypothetical protein
MSKVAVTPRQRLVLRVAEFFYVEGVDKIAAVAGLKAHAVRYDNRSAQKTGKAFAVHHYGSLF